MWPALVSMWVPGPSSVSAASRPSQLSSRAGPGQRIPGGTGRSGPGSRGASVRSGPGGPRRRRAAGARRGNRGGPAGRTRPGRSVCRRPGRSGCTASQVPPACSSSPPISGGARPVPGRRVPWAAGELVADAEQQQRHRGLRCQADHDRTHQLPSLSCVDHAGGREPRFVRVTMVEKTRNAHRMRRRATGGTMSDRLALLNLLWPHGPRRKRRPWRPPWDEQPDDPRGPWDGSRTTRTRRGMRSRRRGGARDA